MSGSRNHSTFSQWNAMQQKEEGEPTLCDSMDGSGETLLFKRNTLKIERGRGTD